MRYENREVFSAIPNRSRAAGAVHHWQLIGRGLCANFPADVLLSPFSTVTTRFVNRVTQLGGDASNQQVVENIADALTGANPKNWSEKGETLFNFNLRRTICRN